MKVYRVGGSVRDELLGLPITERDWLVVGSTVEEMLAQGFMAVGKDFPVFLHPRTKEEYALARTERKNGVGYKGFAVHASPEVTVEEDVLRRDLTINTLVIDDTGAVHDYCGRGLDDLRDKYLRHVSHAFTEDPLRLLRVARFYGRFASLGFRVAEETKQLLKHIAQSGELGTLAQPRIVTETNKCLASESPACSIQLLHECGALPYIFADTPIRTKPLFQLIERVVAATNNQSARSISCLLALLPLDAFCRLDAKQVLAYGFNKDFAKSTATAALLFQLHQTPTIDTALAFLHSAARTDIMVPTHLLAHIFIQYSNQMGWSNGERLAEHIATFVPQFSLLKPTKGVIGADIARDMQTQKQACASRLLGAIECQYKCSKA